MADVVDLRDMAVHVPDRVCALIGVHPLPSSAVGLDNKTQALVRLAVLHALDTSEATYQTYVSRAFAAGCTASEMVGTLLAVGGLVGEAKAVSGARPLALALGYDLDAAIESSSDQRRPLAPQPRRPAQ